MRHRRLGSLVRDPAAWLVAAALGAVVALQASVAAGGGGRGIAVSALFVVVVAGCVVAALDRGRIVLAGTSLALVSPGVLYEAAQGATSAALAALLGVAVVVVLAWRQLEPGVAIPVVGTASVGALIWWFVTSDEQVGLVPGWDRIGARTGATLRAAVGGVGTDPAGATRTVGIAVTVWVLAVGVVVGASVVAGMRRAATALPIAVGLFVVTAWAIDRWRGPVDPTGGTWLLAVGLATAGASPRLDRVLDRRLGRTIIVLVSLGWMLSLLQQVRRDGASWAELVATTAVPIAAAAAVLVGSGIGRLRSGVNVIGYFDVTSGLGERARLLVEVLRAGGIPVSEWPVGATPSPTRHERRVVPPATPDRHSTTIAVVTALEFAGLDASHRDLLRDAERVIGYWFWELETVPDTHAHALSMVDEVWAPTRFVRDAYRAATTKPVRLVALPIPAPATPASGADPFERDGDTVFLVSFDHLSVMARKNPVGAIEAFRRAFPDGDEPVRLVIKTINGDRVPADAAALAATTHDHRVRVWDEHLPEVDHLGLIAAADAFVSLHRSEGLGLQPAAAMWLGTPVIASAYSGTLDLMDHRTALLVPVHRVGVVDGGDAYPSKATWAEPDLDAAAAAMRRVVSDPASARSVAAAARARMEAQRSIGDAGRALRRVLTGWAPDAALWSPTDAEPVDSVATMDSSTDQGTS